MKLKPIFLATLLAASGWVQAADLLETFHAAQANDPVFAAARATQQAGQEKLSQGRSLLMPSININANTTFNNQNAKYQGFLSQASGDYNYNSNGYGVTLVQPLFRQQNWQAYSESELQAAQAGIQLKIAEQDLILRTAQAYFDVLIAQDSVGLAEAQKTSISEQLEQAKRNFDVGSATITDTLEAQARFDQTGAQQIAAQNNLEIKRSALQQLINAMPKDLKPLGKEFKLEAPQPADMDKWVETAQSGNLQLAIAQASAEIADKEVARNRGGHYPTVDLVANYSKNSTGGVMSNETTGKSVGVQLNMPLFPGGRGEFKMARSGSQSRTCEAGTGKRAPQCRSANTPGLSWCGQRHRPGSGVAAGARFQSKRAGSQQARP